MDLKFVTLLKSFFPKGKIWEFQTNVNYLINGLSVEYGRAYNTAKDFYNNFNIINSEVLASPHGKDYLIIDGLYNDFEIQRIIVKYLNKDLGFKEIIEDFAYFISVPIEWGSPAPLEFGVFQFADEFGTTDGVMELLLTIGIDGVATCQEYNKITWLVGYLKPPYLSVTFSDPPITSITPLTFGYSQFGDDFGELESC